MDFNQVLQDIQTEFNRARMEDPSHFRSRHEGYAFLEEEVDELWDEVKKKSPSKSIMYEEAKQVAAVAVKFMLDCCGPHKAKFCFLCHKHIPQDREMCVCGASSFYYGYR